MTSGSNSSEDLQIKSFKDKRGWSTWLDKNHASSRGVWLRIAKKAAGIRSVSYSDALEVALCYGWIDGQKRSNDEVSWLQKFTPRRAGSIWSAINREKALELIKNGQMKPGGLKAIDLAKENGQWASAYDSQSKITLPPDFQAELDKNAKAKAFFSTLNSANRYAFLFRLQNARKPETRLKRLQQFIAMLEAHQKFH